MPNSPRTPYPPYAPQPQHTTRTAMPRVAQQVPRRTTPGGGPMPPPAYAPQQSAAPRRKRRMSVWPIPVIFVCLALLLLMGWYVQKEYAGYQEFQGVVARVSQPGFYPGITIDGISLTGQSLEGAQQALAQQNASSAANFGLTIQSGELRWRITAEELPLSFDASTLLKRAYAIGRSGNLRTRYGTIGQLEAQGIDIQSNMTFDESRVDELVAVIGERLDVAVQEAQVSAFDPLNKTFVFSDPSPGYQVDRVQLSQSILSALRNQDYDTPIEVVGSAVLPSDDSTALVASRYGLIASFSTETTSNANRNTNISLSSEALNGSRIAPGETFSFNEATGQRTSAKGYKEAGAISGGELIDAFGGGVCQTSSTLFNAVVRANLPIVERSKHSWPASYVPRGEDAAVDWPNLDFKFQNDQDTDIFLVAWYENRTVTVEVYGQLLPEGLTIDLVSETMEVYEPSNETIYTQKENMTRGTQREAKKKRTGYLVDTYKVFSQDGEPVAKEKLWTTKYNPVQREIYYN